MKLDLDRLEELARDEQIAGEMTGLTQVMLRPDELAALVRIAREAVACQRSWNPRALRTNSELDMADALREAGL